MIQFQTINKTWIHGYKDPNTKSFKDAVKFFNKEMTNNIIDPALESQKLEFQVNGFKKGPGNVVIVKAILVVKQSHFNNSDTLKKSIRAKTIAYYEQGQHPKTL